MNAAVAVFVALFAILITTVLIRLLGQAAGGRLPSEAVLALIGFGAVAQLPIVLSLTLFIAVLMPLSRTYRDSEMVVWFASGVPLTAWVSPVLRFAVPFVVLIGGVTLLLSPWAQLKSAEYKLRLNNQDDASRVAPGVFRESAGSRRVFFVEGSGEEQGGRVQNVFVSSIVDGKVGIMVAAEGFLRNEPSGERYVVLENGRRYEGSPGQADYRIMNFERYALRLDSKPDVAAPQHPRTLSTAELLQEPTPRNLGELVSRVGMPISALVLALMAIPLSFVNPRAGRTNNLLMSILIYLVYSNAISVCQSWVSRGRLGVVEAVLIPHVAMLLVMGALFYKRLSAHIVWRRRA